MTEYNKKIESLLRKHLRTVSYTPVYFNLKEIFNQRS